MLKRLYIDNYRCLVNFKLEFQKSTLLTGPNGSGKSSVLAVLLALRKLLMGRSRVQDPDVFPSQTLTRWQQRNTQVIELTAALEEEPAELIYRLEIEHDHRDKRKARISLERLLVDSAPLFEFIRGEVHLYRDDYTPGPVYSADWSESAMARVAARHDNQRLTRFLDFMRGLTICWLNPKVFATESTSEDPLLEVDGSNFASWYRHQHAEHPDRTQRLVDCLREVIDGFSYLQMEKVGSETRALTVAFSENENGERNYSLRFDELSDGQRAVIALYAMLYLADKNDVLLIDEPDNFIALAEIQPWLMALSDACGEAPRQAMICSHHPEVYDYLGAEAGVLLKRERTGVVTVRSLREVASSERDPGLKLSEIVARGWEQ